MSKVGFGGWFSRCVGAVLAMVTIGSLIGAALGITVPLLGSLIGVAAGAGIGLLFSTFAVPVLVTRDLKQAYDFVLLAPLIVALVGGVVGLGLSVWIFAGGSSVAGLVWLCWVGGMTLLSYGLMFTMIFVAAARLPRVWSVDSSITEPRTRVADA